MQRFESSHPSQAVRSPPPHKYRPLKTARHRGISQIWLGLRMRKAATKAPFRGVAPQSPPRTWTQSSREIDENTRLTPKLADVCFQLAMLSLLPVLTCESNREPCHHHFGTLGRRLSNPVEIDGRWKTIQRPGPKWLSCDWARRGVRHGRAPASLSS
jgi:hypothetical protein